MAKPQPPVEMPLFDSELELKEPSKKNGLVDEAVDLKSISSDTHNHQLSDQKPIKISVSPFLQNNIISHELQETDICDNNSVDPFDCDRENINNNCLIKSYSHTNDKTDGKCDEHVNSNNLQTDTKNNIIGEHKINNNTSSENQLKIFACGSSDEKKGNNDSVSCKLEFSKLKDDGDLGEKRVLHHKCIDTDSEEDSPAEEYWTNEEYDNSAYNTEIQDVLLQVPKSPVTNFDTSRRSSLKRKLEDDDDYGKAKKRRKNIQFDGVTVFYFPRSQGFNCVPSQGGSTLGMSRKHFCIKRFSLTEHATEQKRAHKEQILQSRLQNISSSKKGSCSSSEESEDVSDISDSEMESESCLFLQPLPIRQRRTLLRQAGIRQIGTLEKEECKDIRVSREMCGCQCKETCYPETCQCAEAGIKCQVDRHNFPCGCTRDGCQNESGRIEFNPIRVRTHFLQTLMRMEIEKRHSQWENADSKKPAAPWFMSGPATSYIQSLNSGPALANENSCSHIPDASNLCVSFDLNQHVNKNTIQHYQSNDGDYNSNGCYMFCGHVSPFNSVSSFSPTYCSTLSNFPSQNGFCHSCNSYSLNKLSSCSSPFSSNYAYSNATFAAAVAVVGPGAKNHYGLQNNISFSPSSSSMPYGKINQNACGSDSSNDHSAIMQAYNGGSSNVNKQNNFLLNEMLNDVSESESEAESYPYSKFCSLSPVVSHRSEGCSSAVPCELPSNANTSAIDHQHFSQFKSPLSYFDEPSHNSSLNSCASPHQGYFNVANQFLDVSIAKSSVSRNPHFNNSKMLQLKHSFISEKEETSTEFCHASFTSATDSAPASSGFTSVNDSTADSSSFTSATANNITESYTFNSATTNNTGESSGFTSASDSIAVVAAPSTFTSGIDNTVGVVATSSINEDEKNKAIMPKVEDLIIPLSSCSKELANQVPSVCQLSSYNSCESSLIVNQFSKSGEPEQQKSKLNHLAKNSTTTSEI